MPCVVPMCFRPNGTMVTFPTDVWLAERWCKAIQLGTGEDIRFEEQEQSLVCEEHFPVQELFTEGNYEEPTRFVTRNGTVEEIASCRFCLDFYRKEDMLSPISALGENRIDVLASELFNTCLQANDLFQLICQSCVARIDIVKSIQAAFTNSELTYQKLVESTPGQVFRIKEELDICADMDEGMSYTEEVDSEGDDIQTETYQATQEIQIEKVDSLEDAKEVLKKKCYICLEIFQNSSELFQHLTEYHISASGYHCQECSKDITSLAAYNRHLGGHDKSERPIKCRFCPMRYPTAESARAHVRHSHGKNPKRKQKRSTVKSVVCDQCGKFFHPHAIKSHVRQMHEKVSHKCHLCERTFTTGATLARHMLLHSNSKPYECDQCDKSYRRPLDLRHHKSLVHDGINPHVCTECNEEFKSYMNLYNHRQVVHLKKTIKRFKTEGSYGQYRACRLCKVQFRRDKDLIAHVREQHSTEEYPMCVCSECPRSFIAPSQLSIHKSIHTDKYACPECGQRHIDRGTLQFHMDRKHSDGQIYECPECDQSFNSRFNLYRHSILHTKGKRFQCDFCPKTFLTTNQLKTHRRTHTGEKPFQCGICNTRFGDDGTFSKHKKRCQASVIKQEKAIACMIEKC